MFSRCSLDVPRMIAGFFQGDHLKWKIQRNSMIPNYSMIPAIKWSPAIQWSPAIWWSMEVWTLIIQRSTVIPPSLMVLFILRLHNIESLSRKDVKNESCHDKKKSFVTREMGRGGDFWFFCQLAGKGISGMIIIIRWSILRSSTRRRASTGTNIRDNIGVKTITGS